MIIAPYFPSQVFLQQAMRPATPAESLRNALISGYAMILGGTVFKAPKCKGTLAICGIIVGEKGVPLANFENQKGDAMNGK